MRLEPVEYGMREGVALAIDQRGQGQPTMAKVAGQVVA